jgi:DNA recombination protein RmuC
MKIEETAQEITKRVGELGKHLSAYDQFMQALGKSLGTTVNHYNKANKELQKVDKDVIRITGEAIGIEATLIDSPDKDEE